MVTCVFVPYSGCAFPNLKKCCSKHLLKIKDIKKSGEIFRFFSKISLEDKKKGLILQPQLRQQEEAGEIGKTKE